jgi:hypothetical protein
LNGASLFAKIEVNYGGDGFVRTVQLYPIRLREIPHRHDFSASSGASQLFDGTYKFQEPKRIDRGIIVGKGNDFTTSFSDASIQSIGFSLLRLKKIAKTPGKFLTERLDN